MILKNKTIYVLYRKAGGVAVKQSVDARKSSWSRCTYQVQKVTENLPVGTLESNGVSRNKR